VNDLVENSASTLLQCIYLVLTALQMRKHWFIGLLFIISTNLTVCTILCNVIAYVCGYYRVSAIRHECHTTPNSALSFIDVLYNKLDLILI
jgi:hypothetical protein